MFLGLSTKKDRMSGDALYTYVEVEFLSDFKTEGGYQRRDHPFPKGESGVETKTAPFESYGPATLQFWSSHSNMHQQAGFRLDGESYSFKEQSTRTSDYLKALGSRSITGEANGHLKCPGHSKGRAARNEPMIDWQLQKGAVTLFR
ncbi:hypothetical protein CISG_04279 [Coccidioides immitis RMSCC 3703]|uniref:Uncharacterized protein n=2 Tax=Coccidioides immitis TaxID=5501 RepID=A0A0J8TLP9_COCIT|nr:hypothetical protein CIRG_02335 [Coccidioides immitis RMSCC 2394]KMU74572.1 hypothetical protein CISG_04279 [Coccidioides immitis RMSCC 3703]